MRGLIRNIILGTVMAAALCLPPAAVKAARIEPPTSEPPAAIDMGAEIVARAKTWVDAKVPYSQAGYRDGYRTDCSGFVSFAWQVRKPDGQAHSPDGVTLASQYGSMIPFELLSPGDVLDNMRYGDEGHVVIFVKWIEKGVRFEAYEENGGENYSRAVATRLTLQALRDGGQTIVEYEPYAPGPYYVFRSQGIPGYAVVTGAPCLWKTPGNCIDKVMVGEEVNVTFTIRNDGGQVLVMEQLMAGTRGPWAKVQGWLGPPADFPPDINAMVAPGQSYTYTRSRSFTLVGDYFLEAVMKSDGWQSIMPWPRITFDVMKPQ